MTSLKPHNSLLLVSALLVLLYGSLSAQVVTSRTDSTLQYEYEWLGRWNADSARWTGDSKYSRVFDQDGNRVLYTWTHWRVENGWKLYDSIWTDYDASGNILFRDDYKWEWTQEELIGKHRDEYFRDATGNDTLKRSSEWNPATNDWEYSNFHRRKFDDKRRIVEDIVYVWYWNEEVWNLNGGQRFEYILNTEDDVETEIISNLYKNESDTSWGVVTRIEYTYDDSRQMLIEEGYGRSNDTWVLRFKQEWAYDENGNLKLHTPYWWNPHQDTLGYRLRYATTFDSHGWLLVKDVQVWDSVTRIT